MSNIESTKLIDYILRARGRASVTELMKLSYLADLKTLRELGNQISGFKYERYKFGPFDPEIYSVLEAMLSDDLIKQEIEFATSGKEHILYSLTDKPLQEPLDDKFITIIQPLLDELAPYGASILTDITYQTKPMKAIGAKRNNNTGFHKPLNLSI